MAASEDEANQMRAAIQQLQAQLQGLHAQATQAQTAAAQARPVPPEEPTRLESVVDMRLLNRLPSFNGDDSEWKTWSFVFESMASLVDLDGLMERCTAEPTEANLHLSAQTAEMQVRMKALYHVLITTCKGKALSLLQMCPRHNGAITWRRMKEEYEPRSGGRLTALLMGLLRPEWDKAAQTGAREWEQAWMLWEKNVNEYEAQSGEKFLGRHSYSDRHEMVTVGCAGNHQTKPCDNRRGLHTATEGGPRVHSFRSCV